MDARAWKIVEKQLEIFKIPRGPNTIKKVLGKRFVA